MNPVIGFPNKEASPQVDIPALLGQINVLSVELVVWIPIRWISLSPTDCVLVKVARGNWAIERRISRECLCLSFWTTCVFCAGVARLPKPRLADFLGSLPLHATAGLLPANLLLFLSAVSSACRCDYDHGAQLQVPLDLLLSRYVPTMLLAYAEGQIAVLFLYSLAILHALFPQPSFWTLACIVCSVFLST